MDTLDRRPIIATGALALAGAAAQSRAAEAQAGRKPLFAVLGPIHPASKIGHLANGAISLAVNGTIRQNSNLDRMTWSVAEQIAKLSEAFELKAGTSSIPARRRMSARWSGATCSCAGWKACRTCRSGSCSDVVLDLIRDPHTEAVLRAGRA